jgi:hypothetical protein
LGGHARKRFHTLAGKNVTALSGVTGSHRANLGRIAETLTEEGVLTRDLAMIRNAARETLVQVLSCRENQSASGMGVRYAGTAIDADTYLPNMATEAFLPALSRAAIFGEGDGEEEADDVAIDGAPGKRNDDGPDGHDPIGGDDEATTLPDDHVS